MNEKTAQNNERGKHRSKPFPIVAIGASAGGLQAVAELLKNLSPETGMAYVYVQHLSPDHKSNLADILQRETKMKVVEAENMMPIKANHFFIIPPNKDMTILDGVLKLNSRDPRPALHLPINRFFLSLAEKQKEGSIGIVLSGAATDGALGLKAIKAAGGLTYAQDESGEFQSMPQASIAEDAVDAILSPKEIANELERISKKADLLVSAAGEDATISTEEHTSADEASDIKYEDLSAIFSFIKKETGVDFSHYKRNTIQRRIVRRLLLNKRENLQDYIGFLKNNKSEIIQLYQDLLINVTHFFRDNDTCEYLKKELLPKLLEERSLAKPLRVWVPACSTGQEAYSLAMLLLEVSESNTPPHNFIQIFGSDLSERAITKARVGSYFIHEMENVSPERLAKFFDKVDGQYRIKKIIREMCVFAPQNIIKDPPFSRIDLISCCNLLIYLDITLQKKILSTFHYSLNKSGYLVLSKSETIGSSTDLFVPLDKKIRIFEKKNNVTPNVSFDINFISPLPEPSQPARENKPEVKGTQDNTNLEKIIDNVLLSQYTPPSVVVTHQLDIVQFRGSTGLFLEPSPGKASLNLLKMARTGLALELRNAAYKVIKTGQPEKKTGIELTLDGKHYHVGFEVAPLNNVPGEQLLLVVFNEERGVTAAGPKTSLSKDRRVKQLEAELITLREDMRSIVEEQEAANEELQSANEEIVSSNEELQSINEELETSKEELESSNEELLTINQELVIRNDMLAEAHEYSDAIIDTIREAVIVLDGRMRIKSANRSFYNTFKLREEETEGRLIYEIGNWQWNISKLRELLEDILPKNSQFHGFEVKHTFPGIGEKVMVLNAKKIRQNLSKEYILLAIEDITEHKQAEKLIEEREAWLRKMADNVPVMIWVANADRSFTFLNKTWLAFTGRTLLQETGIGWTEGVDKDDLQRCLSTYNSSFNQRIPFSIEYRMRRHDGEYRWILNRAVPTYDANGEFTGYTGSCSEIHDKRLLNEELERMVHERTQELQEANKNLERSNGELQEFAYVASHDLQEPLRKIITFSNRLIERYADGLPETSREYIEKINNSADRMRQLIDDVLNFSRISKGDKKFVRTDLNKVLDEVLKDFDLSIQEKNASIHIGKLPVIQAIPLQMNQLFHNLLGNSLKFTSPGVDPVIDVSCSIMSEEEIKKYPKLETSLNYYKISFKDNGIGFPQEFAEQVFVIFQRLNDKQHYSGTGIGLALCRKIVRNHDGEIFPESEENKGTTFYIIIPTTQIGNG